MIIGNIDEEKLQELIEAMKNAGVQVEEFVDVFTQFAKIFGTNLNQE